MAGPSRAHQLPQRALAAKHGAAGDLGAAVRRAERFLRKSREAVVGRRAGVRWGAFGEQWAEGLQRGEVTAGRRAGAASCAARPPGGSVGLATAAGPALTPRQDPASCGLKIITVIIWRCGAAPPRIFIYCMEKVIDFPKQTVFLLHLVENKNCLNK